MPTLANINFGRTPLPNTQWNGDISALLDLLVAHLTGTLDNGAIAGQVGGSQPSSNVGPWLNNNTWYNYDTVLGVYQPFPMVTGTFFGGSLFTTQLLSTANAANIQ